ncbi:MAG: glycosyltransferase [Solirubrobacterales bacterium]
MIAVEIIFWVSLCLLIFTHIGYPAAMLVLARLHGARRSTGSPRPAGIGLEPENGAGGGPALPLVSLIVAAHDEEEVIAERIRNLLELDYPRDRLQIVVASDGSGDETVGRAQDAGADLVLDLARVGKIEAQNEAVRASSGELLAFSDANAFWAPDALRRLLSPFEDEDVAYVCGQVRFTSESGDNQEGAYWRYEMGVRALESRLAGVTGGNGAIYAVRGDAYVFLAPSRSHDLSFPFELTKRGHRAVYAADATATEKMVPTVEGEFARKRRMMRGLWDIVARDGMLSPRGYTPLYAFQIASHRLLRYLSPFLHLLVLGTNIALLGSGTVYVVTLALQVGFLAAAALGLLVSARIFRLPYYYVLVTASIAAGLYDRLRLGAPGAWEKAEGTR